MVKSNTRRSAVQPSAGISRSKMEEFYSFARECNESDRSCVAAMLGGIFVGQARRTSADDVLRFFDLLDDQSKAIALANYRSIMGGCLRVAV
jgi:hypothetical protein